MWIRNEGGVEVTITGDVDGIEYDGLYAYNPENGMLAAANIETGWIVITGDIQGYEITLACDQSFEDVTPEAYIVRDVPERTVVDDGGGPSIASMTPFVVDWEGQDVWLWT